MDRDLITEGSLCLTDELVTRPFPARFLQAGGWILRPDRAGSIAGQYIFLVSGDHRGRTLLGPDVRWHFLWVRGVVQVCDLTVH